MARRRKPLDAQTKRKISQALKGKKKGRGGASKAKKKLGKGKKAAIAAGVVATGAAARYGGAALGTANDIRKGGRGVGDQARGLKGGVETALRNDARRLKNAPGAAVKKAKQVAGSAKNAAGSAASSAKKRATNFGKKAKSVGGDLEHRGRQVTKDATAKRNRKKAYDKVHRATSKKNK